MFQNLYCFIFKFVFFLRKVLIVAISNLAILTATEMMQARMADQMIKVEVEMSHIMKMLIQVRITDPMMQMEVGIIHMMKMEV